MALCVCMFSEEASRIAYVIWSLCLAHCAHDIYHRIVSAGTIIDRPLFILAPYIHTYMDSIQFGSRSDFYVLLLFAFVAHVSFPEMIVLQSMLIG